MYEGLKIDFNPEYRLAICRPRELLDPRFARQLLNFLLALEEVSPDPFNRFLDLTAVNEVRLSSAAIHAYADARREATAHLREFRTAIVAPGSETESAALLYAVLMEGSKIVVRVFRAAGSAADWLGVPKEVVAVLSD